MSDSCSKQSESVDSAALEGQIANYIDACRGRIPEFVAVNYAGRGAIDLNRRALGTDLLVAPFNFLMGVAMALPRPPAFAAIPPSG